MRVLEALQAKLAPVLRRAPGGRVDIVIALAVTVLGLATYAYVVTADRYRASTSFVQNMELSSLDARFQVRGARPHDERIVIVGIDEKTLQKVGSWPVSRKAYAQMVDQLAAAGARIVSFDVAFPTPEKNSAVEALDQLAKELGTSAPPTVLERIRAIQRTSDNDVLFAQSMQSAGNVVLGYLFLDEERAKGISAQAMEQYANTLWGKPIPQVVAVDEANPAEGWERGDGVTHHGIESNITLLADASLSYGFFNNDPDNDGVMRRAPLVQRYQGTEFQLYPSLAFQTVREYEKIKDQSIVAYVAPNGMERIEFGPYNVATMRDGSVLVNFTGPYRTYKHYSMADVIDGTVPKETFKDKIVLVGATALGIGDLRSTPFGKQDTGYMGVEIHANVVDNLLHSQERGRGFLRRDEYQLVADVAFILMFGLGLGYWFGHTKPLHATVGAAVAVVVFGAAVYAAFAWMGMWLHFVVPAGTLLVNYASITSYRMIFEEREKRKIRKSFSTYVSPGVIGLLEKDPKKYFKAGGESKELTVMFSDIRNFTNMSEGMTADELVRFLNEYLSEMTDIVFRRWGTLDKYIGDAVMAFWGSPYPQTDHAVRACAAALDMSARLDELNVKWELEGKKPIGVGIGVNTGVVNVGNMGSSKRLSWTVMGDNVNLASRLEGLTKNYHARIVIAEGTYHQVKEHYVLRALDKIRVKGKLQPVNIYELLDFGKEAPKWQNHLALYNDALAAYRRQSWEEATMKFEVLLQKFPNDGAAQVLLERSQEFRKHAPVENWDGVYVFTSK